MRQFTKRYGFVHPGACSSLFVLHIICSTYHSSWNRAARLCSLEHLTLLAFMRHMTIVMLAKRYLDLHTTMRQYILGYHALALEGKVTMGRQCLVRAPNWRFLNPRYD